MNRIAIAIMLGLVATAAAAQTINPNLRLAPAVAQAPLYDPAHDIGQLKSAVAALQAQVSQLQQDNASLRAQLKQQDSSIGQLTVQIVGHSQRLNSLDAGLQTMTSDLNALSVKFANHRHGYQRANLTSTKVQVVKSTGGLTSSEVDGWASYINDFWTYDEKTTGPQ